MKILLSLLLAMAAAVTPSIAQTVTVVANQTTGTVLAPTNLNFARTLWFSNPSYAGLQVNRLTQGQINLLTTATNGSIVYNTTTETFQFRQLGAWVNLGTGGGGSGGFDLSVNGAALSSANLTNSAQNGGWLVIGTNIFFVSTNYPFLNGTNRFTGPNTMTNTANLFVGNGAGLTVLNASSLASGSVSEPLLPSTITRDTEWDTIAKIEAIIGNNILTTNEAPTLESSPGANKVYGTDGAGNKGYQNSSAATSVALTVPNQFSVSGSPVAPAGTLSVTLTNLTGSGALVAGLLPTITNAVLITPTMTGRWVFGNLPTNAAVFGQVLKFDGSDFVPQNDSTGGAGSLYVNGSPISDANLISSATANISVTASTNVSVTPTNLLNNQISATAAIAKSKIDTNALWLPADLGTGTADNNGFLRGDQAWTRSVTDGQMVGLFSGTLGFGAVDLANGNAVTGTLADGNLSANVVKLNGTNAWTGTNNFTFPVILTNTANILAGNGAGITSVNAATVVTVDSTDATSSIAMFDSATGNQAAKTDAGLTYNATTGVLTSTAGFAGPLTGAVAGNVTGNLTGNVTGNVTGNADTATTAATSTIVDSTDSTSSVVIVDSATGNLPLKTDGSFTYNAANGTVTALTFAGAGGGLTLDASGFNGNLTTGDNTLQEVAQKLDDFVAGVVGADTEVTYNKAGVADGASGVLITAETNLTVIGTLQVGASTGSPIIQIGNAGVQLTDDGDGALTFLGLGNGADEDLTFNFDDTVNNVVASSSTGVTNITATAIGITALSFTGPLIGNASTATTATLASTSTIVDGSDSTSFPTFVDTITGSLALKTDPTFIFDPTTGTLGATTFSGAGGGLTLTASGFDGNLTTSDNTLQEVAQKVDDLVLGGVTTWTDIGDASADTAINLSGFETDFLASLDSSDKAIWTITNNDADTTADTSFLDLRHSDSGDANVFYMRLIGAQGGTPTNDYSFSQTAMTIAPAIAVTMGPLGSSTNITVTHPTASGGVELLTLKLSNTNTAITRSLSVGAYTVATGDATARDMGGFNFREKQEWTTTASTRDSIFEVRTFQDGGSVTSLAIDGGAGVITLAANLTGSGANFTSVTNTGMAASQAVHTDANKALVSNPVTGTGNSVLSSGGTQTNGIHVNPMISMAAIYSTVTNAATSVTNYTVTFTSQPFQLINTANTNANVSFSGIAVGQSVTLLVNAITSSVPCVVKWPSLVVTNGGMVLTVTNGTARMYNLMAFGGTDATNVFVTAGDYYKR